MQSQEPRFQVPECPRFDGKVDELPDSYLSVELSAVEESLEVLDVALATEAHRPIEDIAPRTDRPASVAATAVVGGSFSLLSYMSPEQKEKPKPPLLVLIEVSPGVKHPITLHEGDVCSALALDFIRRHQLPREKVWEPLTLHLQRALDNHLASFKPSAPGPSETAAAALQRTSSGRKLNPEAKKAEHALSRRSSGDATQDPLANQRVGVRPSTATATANSAARSNDHEGASDGMSNQSGEESASPKLRKKGLSNVTQHHSLSGIARLRQLSKPRNAAGLLKKNAEKPSSPRQPTPTRPRPSSASARPPAGRASATKPSPMRVNSAAEANGKGSTRQSGKGGYITPLRLPKDVNVGSAGAGSSAKGVGDHSAAKATPRPRQIGPSPARNINTNPSPRTQRAPSQQGRVVVPKKLPGHAGQSTPRPGTAPATRILSPRVNFGEKPEAFRRSGSRDSTGSVSSSVAAGERLYALSALQEEKRKAMQTEVNMRRLEEEVKELRPPKINQRFTPNRKPLYVDPTSSGPATNSGLQTGSREALSSEEAEVLQHCTFQPNAAPSKGVREGSTQLQNQKHPHTRHAAGGSIVDRLMAATKAKEQRLAELREYYNERDPKTGKKLFQPLTNMS